MHPRRILRIFRVRTSARGEDMIYLCSPVSVLTASSRYHDSIHVPKFPRAKGLRQWIQWHMYTQFVTWYLWALYEYDLDCTWTSTVHRRTESRRMHRFTVLQSWYLILDPSSRFQILLVASQSHLSLLRTRWCSFRKITLHSRLTSTM